MARRRKNGGVGGLVYLLVPILAYFAPALMVGLWIFAEIRWHQLAEAAKDAGIEPDPTFALWREILEGSTLEHSYRMAQLDQLGEAELVSRRMDGRFDARSSLGKRLSFELQNLENEIAASEYWSLRIRRTVSARSAFRVGTASWLIVTAVGLASGAAFSQASSSASLYAIPAAAITYLMMRLLAFQSAAPGQRAQV